MVKEPNVNGLIFKELIKRGYSLDGNTRIWNIADSKLWYLTPEQAQSYLDTKNNPDYKKNMIDNEIELLKSTIPKIMKDVPMREEITLVDVGCGDGKKAIVPINIMKSKHKIKYCPIDISGYMVEKAIGNIKKIDGVDEVVEFQWNVSDFENLENVTQLLRYEKNPLFILFLGSTIGNFDTHDLLYALQNSMDFGDTLLIGISLHETGRYTDKEIIDGYLTEEVNNFLGHVLLELGFNRDEIEFGAQYKHHRVECFYTIKNDKEIKFQDKQITFNKGDRIIISYSYKYTQKAFDDMIKLYFGNYKFYTNKEKDWTLLLCRK